MACKAPSLSSLCTSEAKEKNRMVPSGKCGTIVQGSLISRSGRVRLVRALEKLRRALEKVPREHRRVAIQGLSRGVRVELLRLMESRATSKLSHDAAHPGQVAHSEAAVTLQFMHKSSPTASLQNSGDAAVRSFGGIVTVRTAVTEYHRVRCQISGVVVTSWGMRQRAEAQSALQRLRSMPEFAPECCDLEARLHAAKRAFVDPAGLRLDNGVTFAVVLDARRWIGRNIRSPSTGCLDEIMWWRTQASEAEVDGWDSVRALWLTWMQVQRPKRWSNGRLGAVHLQTLLAVAHAASRGRQIRRSSNMKVGKSHGQLSKSRPRLFVQAVKEVDRQRTAVNVRAKYLERALAQCVICAEQSFVRAATPPSAALRVAARQSKQVSNHEGRNVHHTLKRLPWAMPRKPHNVGPCSASKKLRDGRFITSHHSLVSLDSNK